MFASSLIISPKAEMAAGRKKGEGCITGCGSPVSDVDIVQGNWFPEVLVIELQPVGSPGNPIGHPLVHAECTLGSQWDDGLVVGARGRRAE